MSENKSGNVPPVLEVSKISSNAEFKEINYKFSSKVKKKVLKDIKIELKRLDKEYRENKTLLESYSSIIVDGMYYMIDRDNLTTSNLNGIHNSRLDMIKSEIEELSYGSKENLKFVNNTSNFVEEANSKAQSNFRVINQEIKKCSNTIISNLSSFSNQLTERISIILIQKRNLQKLYSYIKTNF